MVLEGGHYSPRASKPDKNMLSELRKVTRGWIAMAIIGLLALAFAIWGINDVFKPIQSNEVAKGRGLSVTQQEFNASFNNELERIRAQAKRPVTKQELVDANIHMRVVERLVSEKAFDRLAQNMSVGVSDAMLIKELHGTQAFHNPVTGAFDNATYQMLLARNGFTRGAYEQDLRAGMAREQLGRALVAGVRAPTSFGRIELAFQLERRTISIAAVTPDRVPAPPTPTDEEIETFFKSQASAFALPEYRAFTVVRAEPADFAARVDVPEAKINDLFEFRKAQLVTPERRSYVLLSGATDRAAAETAGRRLAAGEDPDAIARSLNMQSVVFAQKARNEAPNARIGEAVFSTTSGQVTAPIEGVTWSIARVGEVVAGSSPSIDELRPTLRAELAHDEAQTLLNDAVEKFDEIRASGGALEDAANQAGLVVTSIPLIDARGLTMSGQPEAAVLDAAELVQAAFAAAEGDPTDWTSTPSGGSYLVRIDTVRPAGPPPLAQVRDRVVVAWRMQKIADGMRKVVEDIRTAVGGGQTLAAAARAQRVQVVTTSQTIDRRMAAQGGPSPQLMAAVFGAREGEVVSGAGGPGGSVLFVALVEKVERPDPAGDPQMLDAARQAMSPMLMDDLVATVQSVARQEARVRLNQPLIDRIVGKSSSEDGDDGR